MPYTKRPAGGTIIERSTGGLDWLGPWEEIDGTTGDYTLPGSQAAKVDITTHRDILTYGAIKQNGAGIADVTDPSFDILYDPDHAGHQALITAAKNRTVMDFRFTYPGVTRKEGVRGQLSIAKRAPIGGYLMLTVTILANAINDNVA